MTTQGQSLALFAGSFDPITLGHVDLIERGSRLFERLTVVIAINPNKQGLFNQAERLQLVQASLAHLPNVTCQVLEGQLLAQYAAQVGAQCLLRGLRHSGDYLYELPLAQTNRLLNGDLETVFLQADPRLQHISSSLVKELAHYGADLSDLVPAPVLDLLAARGQQI